MQPAVGAVCCDDDPKHQQEPSIAAAWWNPSVVLSHFMDDSIFAPGVEDSGNGFAVSTDGGEIWNRLERDDAFAPNPCDPILSFEPGFALAIKDLCAPGLNLIAGDPATATGYDSMEGEEVGYLYFTAVNAGNPGYFARLQMDKDTATPLSAWEVATVPGQTGGDDKPFISAHPFGVDPEWSSGKGKEVFIQWINIPEDSTDGEKHEFLTISCDYGNEFLVPASVTHGCEDYLQLSEGLQLSYLPGPSNHPDSKWGNAGAVGPEREAYFIWPNRDDLGLDQVYLRKLDWGAGGPVFIPPLPSGSECEPGVTCEQPIVFNQPGISGDGYDGTYVGRVGQSMNIIALTHPSIAVDLNPRSNLCGFGGYLYVVYAAEEPNEVYPEPYNEFVTVDSNIYIVRSRDGGVTWSKPIQVNQTTDDEVVQSRCGNADFPGEIPAPEPICGANSFRRPIQFYPWVAVDRQGRVGVMWHDTHPDFEGSHPHGNPCDGNTIYNIHFAYSLDAGVTWLYGWEINDEPSETGVGTDESWGTEFGCVTGIKLGEYSGLTATSAGPEPEDPGIFHAIWTDFREYTSAWRDEDDERIRWPGRMGDIYTTKVVIEDLVYSMGDCDRDYDVDMDDFANFNTCGVQPLPAQCEMLDLDRDGQIGNNDPYLFMTSCFTGPVTGGGGESATAGGGAWQESTEQEATDPLDAMVTWCMATMSAGERSDLAASIRTAAEAVDVEESVRMKRFANAIDPVE